MKAKQLTIVGASGHGKVIAEIAQSLGFTELCFFDDCYEQLQTEYPYPVLGSVGQLCQEEGRQRLVVVAIGNNTVRQKLQLKLAQIGYSATTLIHPSAVISPSAKIGRGTVVMAGAVINANVSVGDGCLINTGSTIDHDCTLGNFVHISPGANLAGNVVVGKCSWVGIGAAIIQGVTIADQVQFGANTTVISDIAEAGLYVGSPAKRIK